MKKSTLFLLLVIGFLTSASGQELLEPSFAFSGKKTIYITLEDGTELEGTLKDLDRKKGLVKQVVIRDVNKKKRKLKPAEIKYMYLFPSGFDKLGSSYLKVHDATKWNKSYVKPGLIGEGYVFFEKAQVLVKKKERTLLMQVLNPSFGGDVRIYHDPYAKATTSFGIGGVKLAGGLAKSYYIRRGDNISIKVKKKFYKKVFDSLFGDCDEIAKDFPKVKWAELAKHVSTYGDCNE